MSQVMGWNGTDTKETLAPRATFVFTACYRRLTPELIPLLPPTGIIASESPRIVSCRRWKLRLFGPIRRCFRVSIEPRSRFEKLEARHHENERACLLGSRNSNYSALGPCPANPSGYLRLSDDYLYPISRQRNRIANS